MVKWYLPPFAQRVSRICRPISPVPLPKLKIGMVRMLSRDRKDDISCDGYDPVDANSPVVDKEDDTSGLEDNADGS